MPKGGARSRSGPLPRTEAQQRAVGARVRPRNREQRSIGTPASASVVAPPPGMTALQLEFWHYYAPLLEAAGRLTLEGRETLSGYCMACAEIARINQEIQAVDEHGEPLYKTLILSVTVDGSGAQHVNGKTNPLNIALRQWLETKRKYEADLLLSPATAIRVPGPLPGQEPSDAPAEPAEHDFYGEGPTKPQRRPM